MLRNAAIVGLIVASVLLSGCTTLLKQGYYAAVGAQGKFYELQIVDPQVLQDYRAIKVEPFTNDLGTHVPQAVIREVNQNTPAAIQDEHLFYPEGKTLRVTGTIIHYTGKSGMTGAIGSVIGGSEDSVCRVQLLDDVSGQMVGEAICWASVKSAIRRGSGEHGIGVGKAVAKWVERRLPEGVAKARKEELDPKSKTNKQKAKAAEKDEDEDKDEDDDND